MSLVDLRLGDSLAVLPELADASVDALVTDPPAGIEFMGKEWDTFRGGTRQVGDPTFHEVRAYPGRVRHGSSAGYGNASPRATFVAFLTAVLAECYRVLKPGAHAFVWAIPRTSHWTATAIEDAGFEVRDVVVHLFGCLTSDVEVLTPTGWKHGIELEAGEQIAQWDPKTAAVTLAPVERVVRFPWGGPMVRLHNSDTDQVLTPDHRVWHRYQGNQGWAKTYQVQPAAGFTRRSPIRLPLAGTHDGLGIGGEDYAALLGWVWTEGGFDLSGTGVRIYQSSTNADKVDEIAALMDRMGAHKRYDYARTYKPRRGGEMAYTAVTWFFSGPLAKKVRVDLPGKAPTYDLLWRMTLVEKRAFLNAALLGDGSLGANGSWQFYQSDPETRAWFVTLLALVGWRGHDYERPPPRDGGSVSVTQRPDTTIAPSQFSDVDYTGLVWCVQVPTGAFLARRNGHVFVTGNSGFPKSLDVSKAIDKAAGAEREVVGVRPDKGRVAKFGGGETRPTLESVPATEDARRWQGFGTSLKPAAEHWILARKPLSEPNVVANVLRWGTGALNIDACRIEHGADVDLATVHRQQHSEGVIEGAFGAKSLIGTEIPEYKPGGRWPANVTLDEDAAAMLDEQSGERKSSKGAGESRDPWLGGGTWSLDNTYDDRGGASRFFHVVPSANEEDSSASRFRYTAKASRSERNEGLEDRNSHPTVKSVALMRYLIRLVTPPGGIVLDPFMGSGSTGIAAFREGFGFIGIERDPDYFAVAKARWNNQRPAQAGLL